MNQTDISQWQQILGTYAIDVGGKLLAAILFWVLGRWLIGVVGNLVQRALARQHVDATIMRYMGTVINVTLNIMPDHHLCRAVCCCRRRYRHGVVRPAVQLCGRRVPDRAAPDEGR